jgi:hypothetical protein
MKTSRLHAERAQLYENIADVLADPPSPDWSCASLHELKTIAPPPELSKAHAALERAFELAATASPMLEHRMLVRCQLGDRGGRRALIERVLNLLRLAQLATECAHADTTGDLAKVEDRQAEFLRDDAGPRLFELAEFLEQSRWAPFHSAIGTALREVVQHDLEKAAG